MENYRIYFDESERNNVVNILRGYNDIIIDNIDDNSVAITIEHDDAPGFYRDVMTEIDRQVYSMRQDSGV
jgi:hypothetical protein